MGSEKWDLDLDVRWIVASKLLRLAVSFKAGTNLALVAASPAERVLSVAVISATKAQSLAVAVARLAMVSTVSCS